MGRPLERTPEWVVEQITAEAARLGRTPALKDVPQDLVGAARRGFGSWAAAVRAAGFVVRPRGYYGGRSRPKLDWLV